MPKKVTVNGTNNKWVEVVRQKHGQHYGSNLPGPKTNVLLYPYCDHHL